jgi:hypothetical protein
MYRRWSIAGSESNSAAPPASIMLANDATQVQPLPSRLEPDTHYNIYDRLGDLVSNESVNATMDLFPKPNPVFARWEAIHQDELKRRVAALFDRHQGNVVYKFSQTKRLDNSLVRLRHVSILSSIPPS